MKTETTPQTNATKIELHCVCGKTLDIMALPSGVEATAKAQNWRVIGVMRENRRASLCPSCYAATVNIAEIEREIATRD
jgi:hypothetical protein